MTDSHHIRQHLRANVVGYVALFVALSGTAVALPGKNKVDSNDLKRGAVKAKALSKNSVKSKAVRTGSITTPKLRSGAVNADKLAPGAVLTGNLADGAVNSGKLADDSVTRQKIVQGTINGGKIANGAIGSNKVADASLLAQDFAPGQISAAFVPATIPGPITLPRAGAVFVIATADVNCGGPVDCDVAVTVDGAPVNGATRTLSSGADESLLLFGASGPLAAGARTIDIDPGGGSISEPRLTAILLQ